MFCYAASNWFQLTPKREDQHISGEASIGHGRPQSDPFAALTRLRAIDRGRTNLPAQPTPLIGREKELREAIELILRNDLRLLTLTGSGGTGKTRLGIEVAWALVDKFPGGVFLVSLAPITDHSLVVSAIMNALGVAEQGQKSLAESLKDHLRDKRILVVLDNFEHLMPAVSLVSELLTGCPRLKILVTSREPLRIRGEHEFPVLPLMLPDMNKIRVIESVLDYAAVVLFVQRTQAVRPDFTVGPENARTIAEICVRLDGLPLALELAAARMRILTAEEMLNHLQNRLGLLTAGPRDLPARQRTLRDTIAWSYEPLQADDKKLFRRLSVFANGFSFEAVEAVCNAPRDLRGGVLEALSRLVERNLIQSYITQCGTRFGMLETIREFALEALTTSSELKQTQKTYVEYFLSLAEKVEPELRGAAQASWLTRLEQEHDNMRKAIRLSIESKDVDRSLRFASALWRFWYIRGHCTEGRTCITSALANAGSMSNAFRAKALLGLGTLASVQNDFPAGRAALEESLGLFRELGDKEGMAFTLNTLGIITLEEGDYSGSMRFHEESLELMREAGNKWGVGLVLNNLGVVARGLGEYDKATELHKECLMIFKELGDKRHVAAMLYNLGTNSRDKTDYDEARKLLTESLLLSRELEHKVGIAESLLLLGSVARKQRDQDTAGKLFAESIVLFLEIGAKEGIADCLDEYAGWVFEKGEAERAAQLIGACEALREVAHLPLPPAYCASHERDVGFARKALGEDRFAAEREKGRFMTIEEAIACALGPQPPRP